MTAMMQSTMPTMIEGLNKRPMMPQTSDAMARWSSAGRGALPGAVGASGAMGGGTVPVAASERAPACPLGSSEVIRVR